MSTIAESSTTLVSLSRTVPPLRGVSMYAECVEDARRDGLLPVAAPVHGCALPPCEFCGRDSYEGRAPFPDFIYHLPRLWLCVWCAFDHYA